MRKELERDQEKAGIDGSTFVSTQAELCRHTSNIDRVREHAKGVNAD